MCQSDFAADITSIKRHKISKFHTSQVDKERTCQTASGDDHHHQEEYHITRAEYKPAAFFAEHDISFNTADHFVGLLKDLFPECNVLQKVALKRSKLAKVIDQMGQCNKRKFS